MAIYLEMPKLNKYFPFRVIVNDGSILTTPHWHRELEIIYVTKESIHLGINDQPMIVSEGECVFINGGDLHYVLASPGSERVVYQFDITLFSNLENKDLDLKSILKTVPPLSKNWGSKSSAIVELLDKIYEEEQKKEIGSELQIKSAIYQIMVYFIREVTREKKIESTSYHLKSEEILEKLDVVFKFVEEHYTENITLQEASNSVGYSQFYFTKFFKKNTGKTFISFLNDYRIDKAKWLLINTSDTVSEIISQVGFESDKTFYRLFKQSLAISPLAYREKMQK
ncbi:AraC family transcriptional regulator [Vagococcus carniphilus]|uniref:AraC family transcriptional regulator n=1 Tax=Vagococcus carniphilus TaxID=218144 RepID=A0A430AYR1_9ENTE|nr:AraC family transcriptional regulator [Vagococcus carniphilus]QNN72045.1 helix-turn-helix domain-containing protein [Vagococcus carniphilus]RSU13220.1 AraC family transcriptional regulator [Vagococcus carniphilus]